MNLGVQPGREGRIIQGWRCIVDLLMFAVISAVVLVLQYVTPFQRGFFCLDDTIVYPFKPSTISSTVLFIVSFAVPLFLMGANSFRLSRRLPWSSSPKCVIDLCGKRLQLHACIIHFVHFYFIFMVGAAINQLLTDIGKVTIGRLRPNFISVCKPNYTLFNCTTPRGVPLYVLGDYCTGAEKDVTDSRKSWPSGHSSASAYAMIYAVLYVEYCCLLRRMPVARNLVNLLLVSFAFCTILSRIDDNKHHWSDVLSGAIIGAGVAITLFWLNFPTRDRTHYTDAHSEMPHAMYTSGPASEDSGIDETPMTMTNSGDNDVRFDHNPTARREA